MPTKRQPRHCVQVARYKLLAFVITSGIASFSGALFAYYQSFVSVEAFTLFMSIQYIAMIIIGGMGSLTGGCWARYSSPSFHTAWNG